MRFRAYTHRAQLAHTIRIIIEQIRNDSKFIWKNIRQAVKPITYDVCRCCCCRSIQFNCRYISRLVSSRLVSRVGLHQINWNFARIHIIYVVMLHPISHAFATNLRRESISGGVRDKQRVKIIMICVSISSQKINKTHLSIARSFVAIHTDEDLRTPAAQRRRRIVFCDFFFFFVCVTETDVSARHVCTIVHLKTLASHRFGRTTAATKMCRLFAIHMIFTICDAAEIQQIQAIKTVIQSSLTIVHPFPLDPGSITHTDRANLRGLCRATLLAYVLF